MKYTTSSLGLKIMDEELHRIEKEIAVLQDFGKESQGESIDEPGVIESYVRYYSEHVGGLLLEEDSERKGPYFAMFFDELPTYHKLVKGDVKLNKLFILSNWECG